MIIKQVGCGLGMAKVILTTLDEKTVKAAIAEHGKRDVYVAVDNTVANKHIANALGLDRYALIGADKAPAPKPAPTKKAEKPKKVEAKKDVEPKSE